ncbi:hypothetical protein IKE71_03795 [Candidatus Saccharibacteria bacterium]|nr:hypothetical protein [Candidatus Saccharibacteria bacterium]
MNEWLSWELIGTFAGTCLVVNLLTQVYKYVFPKASVTAIRIFALIMSEALTILVAVLFQGVSVEGIILAVLNGVLVFASTQGVYHLASDATPKIG